MKKFCNKELKERNYSKSRKKKDIHQSKLRKSIKNKNNLNKIQKYIFSDTTQIKVLWKSVPKIEFLHIEKEGTEILFRSRKDKSNQLNINVTNNVNIFCEKNVSNQNKLH